MEFGYLIFSLLCASGINMQDCIQTANATVLPGCRIERIDTEAYGARNPRVRVTFDCGADAARLLTRRPIQDRD